MTESRSDQDKTLKKLQKEIYSIPLDFKLLNVDFIDQLTKKIINLYAATYDYIASFQKNSESIHFEKVVQPLIDLEMVTSKAESLCTFPSRVHPDEKIRNASEQSEVALSTTKIDCAQRTDVFKVLQLYEKSSYLTEKDQLDHENKRYFTHLMREYKRNGLNIEDKHTKQKIIDLKKQIKDLCLKAEANIRGEKTQFFYTKAELTGLPESWFTKEREDKEKGKYKVTLQYPDYYPVLNYVKNREIRKEIYTAFNTRCLKENIPLLKEIFKLRQELAVSLGYKTHADFAAEVRMAKTPQKIRQFLDEMQQNFKPLFQERLKKLTTLAKEAEKDEKITLHNYDVNYYNRILKEKELNINIEEFDSYFSLDKVIDGIFKIYEKMLGLQFSEKTTDNKWHSDVKLFEVHNYDHKAQTKGEKIGEFYLDLHPRPGKYSHAAAFNLVAGAETAYLTELDAKPRQLPKASMVCNFPKNGGYLSFDEDVITFFHEFGHIMHYLCTKTKLASSHAFATEIDFLEAPSQMLENWCYDHRVLKLLSAHPSTGKAIPEEMVNQLRKMKIANELIENIRQLVLSNFDYYVHSLSAEELEKLDIQKTFRSIQQEIRNPIISEPTECFASSFAHIVSEYDVAYYGYMMSNTYAADMFVNKFKQDPLSPVTGAEYRKFILEPGAKYDGLDLLKNFLGRLPTVDAYVESYGMKVKKEAKPEPSPRFQFSNQTGSDLEEITKKDQAKTFSI